MKYNVIAISRQFGSAGRTVGRELAKKLGIPCYDAEIIEKTAEETNFAPEYIKEEGELAKSGSRLFGMMSARDQEGRSYQDDVWHAQRKVILRLAEQGPCVFVGRCADYILSEREDCLKVFVHADIEFRAKRIVEKYGEQEKKTQKRLRDKDKRRAAYYYYYTDKKWGTVENYDLTLNSGVLGVETCVDILYGLCKG